MKHALEAGLKNMSKWYHKVDDMSIYITSHGKYTFLLQRMDLNLSPQSRTKGKHTSQLTSQATDTASPYAELDKYLNSGLVSKTQCPEPIPLISASICLVECSFSMSARTDSDVRCHQLGSERFGALQILQAAYCNGWLSAMDEAWMDFDFLHLNLGAPGCEPEPHLECRCRFSLSLD